MKKVFSREIKIGIAFLISLFILYFGIKFLKGINIFKPTNSYVVVFDNVTDLSPSSPVLLNGYKVGLVYSMELVNSSKIAVTVNLDKGVKIPKDSNIKLDVSLMGNASVIIDENPYTTSYYAEGDTLQGIRIQGLMESMSAGVLPQIIDIVPKLDSIMTGIQTLVNHPSLVKSLENVDVITSELTVTTKQLNKMMVVLNKDLPVMSSNMITISDNIAGVSNQFNSMNLVSTYNSIDSTLKNVQTLTDKLNSDKSSLGLLLNDRQLYDSLNVTIGNASQLLQDVKDNPSKYINVKVF